MKKLILGFLIFNAITIQCIAQTRSHWNLGVGLTNIWYQFDESKLRGIFIDPVVNGSHGDNLSASLELGHKLKLINRVWISSAAGLLLHNLSYPETMGAKELFIDGR